MKRIIILLIALAAISPVSAQKWVEATELGIHGQTFKNSKYPYCRFDYSPYTDYKDVMKHAKKSTGLYLVFKTNSSQISASWSNKPTRMGDNMTGIVQKGLDLYIKDANGWHFAGVGRVSTLPEKNSRTRVIIQNLPEGDKECLLYLPIWAEIDYLRIGVDDNATIEGLPTPFRHKVVVHGSSITHGASASRSGLTYPALLSRNLGIDFVNFGWSGLCRMQPEFLDILKKCEADAFLFDSFSNPTEQQIKDRVEHFVEEMVKAHPGKPLIFLQSPIDLESYFDTKRYASRVSHVNTASKMMKELTKRYKDVYFLEVPDVLGENGTTDNSHPTDLGFHRFVNTYQPKIAKILKKYGIK